MNVGKTEFQGCMEKIMNALELYCSECAADAVQADAQQCVVEEANVFIVGSDIFWLQVCN